jgi:hypothetical protein
LRLAKQCAPTAAFERGSAVFQHLGCLVARPLRQGQLPLAQSQRRPGESGLTPEGLRSLQPDARLISVAIIEGKHGE